MSDRLRETLASLAGSGAMSTEALLECLYRHAREAAMRGNGAVVEIGAYRGASTVALALGVRDAGRGRVHSIDPHAHYTGVHGGKFSPVDHAVFKDTIRKHGVGEWIVHYCTDSVSVAKTWSGNIDLLWIDGDHSYNGVAGDLAHWLPFVGEGGMVVLDDHGPGSEVEAAVRDHLPFSRYLPIARVGNALALRRTARPRTLVLCGGMQSSGSTLVSWCFLQRADMNGVYDMDNASIQQDFSRVLTDVVWVKMTIGAFRLEEVASTYSSQGWNVLPILITRNLAEVLDSLQGKSYGVDGITGDDPPLLVRARRYLRDVEQARQDGWPVIRYEDLIDNPVPTLQAACRQLGLPWDETMVHWTKPESDVAYMSAGNQSFDRTRLQAGGLLAAVRLYTDMRSGRDVSDQVRGRSIALAGLAAQSGPGFPSGMLSPAVFRGTRRQILEAQMDELQNQSRIFNQGLSGRLYRLLRRIRNRLAFLFGRGES